MTIKNRLIFDNKINLKKTLLPNLEIELLIQVKKLLNDQEYNNKIGTELRTLIINSQTSDNFDKFFSLKLTNNVNYKKFDIRVVKQIITIFAINIFFFIVLNFLYHKIRK